MIEAKACPDCGHNSFFQNKERGEVICRNCSLVVADTMVDVGDDSRSFDQEEFERKSRTGAPFDPRIANQLITAIGAKGDYAKLDKRTKMLMQRISKKNSWTSSSLEVNLNTAFGQMRIFSSFLKLPESVEREAALIYRRAAEKGLTIKRSIEAIVISSLYVASRIYGLPKTMDDFVKAGKVEKKVLGKTYKMIVRELGLKLVPANPLDFINKFGSSLNLSAKVQTNAVKIAEKARQREMTSGLSPVSVAATSLYLSALKEGEKKTQKEVSDTTGITEATLRSRCKDFIRELKLGIRIR
ncbi:hypothetical protein HY641_05055 [Candidatus Woesearchaeota archaeon]|nr:hypothetical protein [Candidatus Woesearchaeota archaeon]